VALLAYFVLGQRQGLVVLCLGLLLGEIGGQAVRSIRRQSRRRKPLELLGSILWPIGQNGISLLIADAAYGVVDTPPPLLALSHVESILAVITATFVFLLAYNLLLIMDLWLARLPVFPTLIRHRQPLLATQLLPIVVPPFGSILLGQLGIVPFLIFELILLTIAVVVDYLLVAQRSLQRQITQLTSFTSITRALRSTIEMDPLLENVYIQARNLLGIQNMRIILRAGSGGGVWTLPFEVEYARRVIHPEGPVSPDGLTSLVLDDQSPILADPLSAFVSSQRITDAPSDARSWMGVPLVASNRVLGCLVTWLNSREDAERRFTEEDLELFSSIAAQTSIALENAQLYDQAHSHALQLERLNEISARLNASLNSAQVLSVVAESVLEVSGCDKAAVFLLEDPRNPHSLHLTHTVGFSPEHRVRAEKFAIPLNAEERLLLLTDKQPIVVSNLMMVTDATPETVRLAEWEGIMAYVYLPLATNQPMGVLGVYYRYPHVFTKSELGLLETFANQATLAVANARVYEQVDVQLTRMLEQKIRLAEISQKMSASLDMEEVFEQIVRTAMGSTEANAAVLVLRDDPYLTQLTSTAVLNMVAWDGFDPARDGRAPHHVVEELAASTVLEEGRPNLMLIEPAGWAARTQLSVPISLDNNVIGALVLETGQVEDAFSEDDVIFVSQLATQAAIAIRNAQLFTRAQLVRERLHAILDSSNDGLLMIDEQSRIVMTNTRMSDFWDFARGDFEARTPEQFASDPLTALGEGLGYQEGELRSLLSKGMTNPSMTPQSDLYITHYDEGKGQRYIDRTAMPVWENGEQFIGLLLVFRDVTQEKELEQAREELTRMMVHDLRGPLTAVMTSLGLIARKTDNQDNIITRAADTSTRAVRKLLNMVNDLLDLSRMSEGEISIDPAPTAVGALLKNATAELSPLAQELNVKVEIEIPEGDLEAMIDADMIERVLINLVDNALKYADSGKWVGLRILADQSSASKPMIRVEVVDRGPGIPEDYKRQIFDRFKQIPGRRSHRASTGIGLAFCKLAVEAHGGRIWVEDNPEGGSRFILTLPAFSGRPFADDAALEAEMRQRQARKK
jgi:K+-sensing histidine kinase KdpD